MVEIAMSVRTKIPVLNWDRIFDASEDEKSKLRSTRWKLTNEESAESFIARP